MKTRKTLSLALVLVMLVSLFSMSAMATNPTSLTGFASPVGSITISGVDVTAASEPVVTSSTFGGHVNYTYTYNIVLAAGTTTNPTVTFTKNGGANAKILPLPPAAPQHMVGGSQDTLTYTPSLNNGVASFYTIAHHDVQGSYGRADSYYFNFTVQESTTVIGGNGYTVSFGDPNATPTEPEKSMYFVGSGNSYTAAYLGTMGDYYPDMLTMSVTGNSVTNLETTGGAKIVTYSSTGDKVEHTSITPATNINNNVASTLYTIQLGSAGGSLIVKNGNSTLVTINFAAPHDIQVPATGNPVAVNGYLPIGQFANGSGWGSASGKLTSGIETTGVSLGMLGGYVQFDMGEGKVISNDSTNPYGIDFIVYGNAFVGNPEAGSVMVSVDGEEWYNLAGSRHYMDGTQWDLDVSYLKIDQATTIGGRSFAVGMYYATNFNYAAADVDTAIAAANWTNEFEFGATAWWPAESYYDTAWNDGTLDMIATGDTGDVLRYESTDGKVEVITYCGVTRVQDDEVVLATQGINDPTQVQMTNVYQWGYADVRENGSNYGTVINPYASAASAAAGGDGFDLSWAVDEDGNPVNLSGVRYVRVYSAVYHYAGIYGETSTEVCGLYVANGTGSGTASAPTITIDGEEIGSLDDVVATTSVVSANQQILTITGLENYDTEFALEVAGGSYVFMNGVATDSTDIVLGDGETLVQIISQSGSAEPFITLIKLAA